MKRILIFCLLTVVAFSASAQIESTIINGDATICDYSNTPITISSDADEISWSPVDSLSCDDCFDLVANPKITTTYTAVLKKAGEGDETIQVTITVLPNDVHFPQGDTLYFCLGETKDLNLIIDDVFGQVDLTSTNGLDSMFINVSNVSLSLTPTDSDIYYSNASTTAGCTDSIYIQVDSLPADMTIEIVDPPMPPYCVGSQITLMSPNYSQANFPNIDFMWTPFVENEDGTPDSLYNLVWTAHEAKVYTYTRVTTNGACIQTDTKDIPVSQIMNLTVDPSLLRGCTGTSLLVKAVATDDETNQEIPDVDYSWKGNGATLSCSDCQEPTAVLQSNGAFQIMASKDGYCPTDGAIVISVENVTLDLPKVFSPNSDTTNDFFTFRADDGIDPADIVSFEIYNRWGNRVYNHDTPSTGWDGLTNGTESSEDVYLYIIKLNSTYCNQEIKGDVTLLR